MTEEKVEPGCEPGCEAVAQDIEKQRMIALMVAYIELNGGTNIHARIEGYAAPGILSGTIENARPDIVYRQGDKKATMTIVEVVPEITTRAHANRWSLLGSAAKLYNAELHFVVKGDTKTDLAALLRNKLNAMDVGFRRVTSV